MQRQTTDIDCLFSSQTEPDVQSVQLFGSWDNFTVSYPLERDLRRGQGEWKGCYTFKDIIGSDQDMAKIRNGGLKMGATYYYYVSTPDLSLAHIHINRLPSPHIEFSLPASFPFSLPCLRPSTHPLLTFQPCMEGVFGPSVRHSS